jgi:hypothetical protein
MRDEEKIIWAMKEDAFIHLSGGLWAPWFTHLEPVYFLHRNLLLVPGMRPVRKGKGGSLHFQGLLVWIYEAC